MSSHSLISAGYIFQVLGSLLLVFGCLVGLMLLLRRMQRASGTGSVPLRVLGSAPVGTRERVVLISAGGQQLLLGIAPGSVRTLHVFPEPVVTEPVPDAGGSDFVSVLRSLKQRGQSR